MFTILAFPLMIAIGFTVDYAQVSSRRADLQNISDAVALAVVKGMPISLAEGRQKGQNIYDILMEDMRIGFVSDSMEIRVLPSNQYFAEVEINAVAKGTFGNMFEINSGLVQHRVISRAINKDPKVEIAAALDVSWSMDDPRMAALETAMNEFMNIVEAEVSSDGIDARVSIIPFAGDVDLPSVSQTWWEGPGNNAFGANCVGERDDDDHRMTTTTPAEMNFPPFSAQPRNCPTVKMLPLTTNVLEIRNHIRKVGSRPRGPVGGANMGTSIHRALAWANRALDPEWHSFLGAQARATTYLGSVRKFVVILTDGGLFNYGSWDYDPNNSLSVRPTPTADAYMSEVCDALKEDGIEVFTIGFKTKPEDEVRLANCASPGQFISGDSTTDLISAFRQVGGNIGGKTPRLVN